MTSETPSSPDDTSKGEGHIGGDTPKQFIAKRFLLKKIALIRRLIRALRMWIEPNLRYFLTTRQATLWYGGLIAGVLGGAAAIVFREMIGLIQWPFLQDTSEFVVTAARQQPWWVILIMPAIGGLIVGFILERFIEARRAFGVADVIEAKALTSRSLPLKQGLWSALVTTISLGTGASAGREGPVVHLGATIASAIASWLGLIGRPQRTLLACGVASAVSASFNAPIAGVLFAHEVILGHYASSALIPIVIASVAGTIMSHQYFGDVAAFSIPDYQITSYWEFPAFALLGVVCAIVAVGFQVSVIGADWIARHVHLKLWMRPVIGGFMVGAIAVFCPEVLGVGYEATDQALRNQLPLMLLITLLFSKVLATAITLASRFGGGVFSPALYLGAMTGAAFGIIAASVFPELASSGGVYAILGMGAVAASVIGAPLSTVLIVFELTGGYAITIALLITVSLSHGIVQAVHGRSFFHWQLEMRGLFIQDGPHKYLVKNNRVRDVMTPITADEKPETFDPASGEPYLRPTDTLETALKAFDSAGISRIVVVEPDDATKVITYLRHVDALRQFNQALIRTSEEEHR